MTTTDQSIALGDLFSLSVNMWADLGPALSCAEADAFEQFLRAYDHDDYADALMERHAASDEEGDTHYRPSQLDADVRAYDREDQ